MRHSGHKSVGRKMSLYDAVESGNFEDMFDILQSENNVVDIDALDCDGYSPLHIAAHEGHDAIVDLLLEAGADPLVWTDDGGNNRWAKQAIRVEGKRIRLSFYEYKI